MIGADQSAPCVCVCACARAESSTLRFVLTVMSAPGPSKLQLQSANTASLIADPSRSLYERPVDLDPPFTIDSYVQLCTKLLRDRSQTHAEAAQRLLPLAQCLQDRHCPDLRVLIRVIQSVHQHWTHAQADEIAQLHARRDQLDSNKDRAVQLLQHLRRQLDPTATDQSESLMGRLEAADSSLSNLERQCTSVRRQITAAQRRWDSRWLAGLMLEPAVVHQCVTALEQLTSRRTCATAQGL